MTRLLLKLHRTLWWRNVKNNVSVAMIAVLIILYTLLGLVSIGLAMSTELSSGKWHALTAAVAIGTGAYALAAMVFPNGENQISPAQLAAQPVTSRDVLPAMGWASVLSSRGIAAVIATVVTTGVATAMFAGAGRPLAAVAAIPLMLVALLTTVVLGELVASFNRGGTRRSKELTNVITLVVGFGAIFGFNYLMGSMGEIPLSSYGRYLAWTPLAAAPGTLASAMHGAWLAATVQLLIAVATAVGGIYLWRFWTVRELTAPLDVRRDNTTDTSRAAEEVARSLLLPWVPAGPGGVIYSRALRYLRRDSRVMGTLVIIPIVAGVFIIQGFIIDTNMLYFGAVVISLFVASTAINDFGYDGPGIASYSLAAVPARTVVFARHLASITVPVFFAIVFNVALVVIMDNTALAAVVAVVCLGLALSSCALAVVLSAFNPYPMSRPGTNPWSDKSGNNAAAYVSVFATLLVSWIPVAPGAALAAIGWGSSISVVSAGVVLVLALPAALYAGAIILASRRYATHFPEIFAKVGHWIN